MDITVSNTKAANVSFGESDDFARTTFRAHQIRDLLFFPKGMSEENQQLAIQNAIDELIDINPENGLERMLAVQMVGMHNAVLECLRRAQIENQSFEAREMNLKYAQKLMDIYLKQLSALDKHRGKNSQKMVVEHINIAPGGQANLGQIELAQQQNVLPEVETLDNILNLKAVDDDSWLG